MADDTPVTTPASGQMQHHDPDECWVMGCQLPHNDPPGTPIFLDPQEPPSSGVPDVPITFAEYQIVRAALAMAEGSMRVVVAVMRDDTRIRVGGVQEIIESIQQAETVLSSALARRT